MNKSESPATAAISSKTLVSLFVAAALTVAPGCTAPRQTAANPTPGDAPVDYCLDDDGDQQCDDGYGAVDTTIMPAYFNNGSRAYYYRKPDSYARDALISARSAGAPVGTPEAKAGSAAPATSSRSGSFSAKDGGNTASSGVSKGTPGSSAPSSASGKSGGASSSGQGQSGASSGGSVSSSRSASSGSSGISSGSSSSRGGIGSSSSSSSS